MPEVMDVFNQDAFSLNALTQGINDMPFVPGRLGQMGLFEESGIAVTTVVIEQVDGTLALLSPIPRGGPGQTSAKEKGVQRALTVPHFQHDDAIQADEVQGVRELGTADQLRTVQGVINGRMRSRVPYFDATLEYQRVGAVKGIITYADATTLDLFSVFGVSQETEIDFDLDNANPASGAVMKKCHEVTRLVTNNLGALPFRYIHAICGDAFFDDLTAHKEVRETYQAEQAANNRIGRAYRSVEYGNIMFENYRGGVGATAFVDTNKAHFFPVGVPNLFKTWFAPADYMETVNTIGLPRYAKVVPSPNNKGVMLEMQTNPLSICQRPKVLIKAKRT